MHHLSVFNDLHKTLWSDAFWPITYFSWIYYHWVGSSVICGIFFSSLVIASHLASWIFIHNDFMTVIAEEVPNDVAVALTYYKTINNTLSVPLLVMIWMIRGRRRLHSVISSIATVDKNLLKFGQCPSKSSTLWKLIPLICFPLVLIGGFFWYNIHGFAACNCLLDRGIWRFYLYAHDLVELYISGLFASLVLLLGDRYKAVNLVLKKISEENGYDLRNTRQLTLNWIVTIRELRAIHRKLFFAANKISKAFGLQLLIMAIISLTTVIGDLYILYLISVLPCNYVLLQAYHYIFWSSIYIGTLCITAFCCSWTSAKEKYTAVLLHEMTVSDVNLRMELSTFSLQLIHYDLRFSACGFYDIDLSFIQTIIGTIATYLVILIQIGTLPQTCRNSFLLGSVITNSSVS